MHIDGFEWYALELFVNKSNAANAKTVKKTLSSESTSAKTTIVTFIAANSRTLQ